MTFSLKLPRNKSNYTRLLQDALNTYSENVVNRTVNVIAYKDIEGSASALRDAQAAYSTALAAAANRGGDEIARKDLAKDVLLNALDLVATEVTSMAPKAGDPTIITAAGLQSQAVAQRREGDIEIPTGVKCSPTLISGEMFVEYDSVDGAAMYGFEWSDDNRETWHNGQYSTKITKALKVSPRKENYVRVCAIGTRDRKSGWSDPVMAFVL